jgi:hypothetical protein
MKRFLKVFALLIISLFVLVSGVNTTLDRMAHAPSQGSFTVYSEKGQVLFAYSGNLKNSPVSTSLQQPARMIQPQYRWF